MRIALAAIALIAATTPKGAAMPKGDGMGAQRAMLKDWALARCIGRGLGPGTVRDDAYASAGALLERGDYDVQVYNRLDTVVNQALAKPAGGLRPERLRDAEMPRPVPWGRAGSRRGASAGDARQMRRVAAEPRHVGRSGPGQAGRGYQGG